MSNKRSIAGYRKISKVSNGGLDARNVYYLELVNKSNFEVIASDKDIGDVPLEPNTPFILKGHPDYPFDMSFTFQFTGNSETNFVTATYLRTNGNT